MNVILLEKVHNLGDLGDNVNVKSGYGRNFLIPKGIAVPATTENIAKLEAKRAELEQTAVEKLSTAEARQKALNELGPVTIAHKAGEEGKLFGSVGTVDIATAIIEAGVDVAKREVRLPEGAIRVVGEYDITIDLHSDLTANIKVNVIAE